VGIKNPVEKRFGRTRLHDPSKAATHAHENNSGTTEGVGPEANGLSQGSNMKKKAATDGINLSVQDLYKSWPPLYWKAIRYQLPCI
jgi:hypothetical protein